MASVRRWASLESVLRMPAPMAELSSLSTALDELCRRVGDIAERAAAEHDDDVATELFAVERALTGASRRLGRITAPPRRRS